MGVGVWSVKVLSVLLEENLRVISCLCLWIIRWASLWNLWEQPGELQIYSRSWSLFISFTNQTSVEDKRRY